MALIPEFLRVNDTPYSWVNCEFKIELLRYVELVAISGSDKRTRKKVKGMKRSGAPLGVTDGTYEADALTMSMLLGAFNKKMIPQLELLAATQGRPGSYGNARFNAQLTIWQPGIQLESVVVTFNKCWVESPKENPAEGPDELITEVTCGVETIARSGNAKLWDALADVL